MRNSGFTPRSIGNRFLNGAMKFWTLFIGVGAVIGAVMMWIDPSGKMWMMDTILDMLREKMPWPDIFFRNFIPSSFVLLGVNGITQFFAAFLLFRRHRLAAPATLACGIILMLWIVVEWFVFGFYGICNAYFTFGQLEAMTALASISKKRLKS